MAKKCYAVRKGFKVGIFHSWDECKSAITGYSGADYKGFNSDDEALAYLNGDAVGVECSFKIPKPVSDRQVNIYTDGSYKNGDVSFGVFMETMNRTFSFHGVVSCGSFTSIANIDSEIFGVLVGVQLAKDMGLTDINIIYDYQGLECWYAGEWKCKGQLQQIYVSLLNNLRLNNDLNYTFIKVKGHSSVEGNRRADKLALRGRTFKAYVDINKILQGTLKVNDVQLV